MLEEGSHFKVEENMTISNIPVTNSGSEIPIKEIVLDNWSPKEFLCTPAHIPVIIADGTEIINANAARIAEL
jgi:hypothetical protein